MTETTTTADAATGPTYTLYQYPETLAVVRLGVGAEVPAWAESSSIFSVTVTATETSVVCAARSVPKKARHERGFVAFEVQGPRDFALTSVLVALLVPLAQDDISVYTQATFDTDWLLIPQNDAERAVEAWRRAGHNVTVSVPSTKSSSSRKSSS